MDDVKQLLIREKAQSVSNRELKHRMMGYGYRLDETEKGYIVSHMRGGSQLLTL